MNGKTIQQIKIGDTAEFTKTVSELDAYLFAGLSGDLNPAHFDESYAKETIFKTRIAHGMLSVGFLSAVMGMQLPGPGAIYLKQDIKFLAPVRFGDSITAKVEVIELAVAENQVILRTSCSNQDGRMVLDGKATVSPAKAPKATVNLGRI